MNRVFKNFLALFLLLFASTSSRADPIAYKLQVAVSGSLGPDTFSNALMSFTIIGDTKDVFLENGLYPSIEKGVVTVSVEGLGTATVFDSFQLFTFPMNYQDFGAVALRFFTPSRQIFSATHISDPAYYLHDLKTEFPFTYANTDGLMSAGSPISRPVSTSAGDLYFSLPASNTRWAEAGFGAHFAAVPEPPGVALFSIGLAVFIMIRARRRL